MALPVATVVVDAAVNWNAASAVAYGAGEITKKWIVQHGHVVASEFVKDALLSAPTGQAVTAAVTAATPAATATAASVHGSEVLSTGFRRDFGSQQLTLQSQ